jgi:glycosyltransferase involved in cell wall biosynthesis
MAESERVRATYVLSTRNRADHLDRALGNAAEFVGPEDELIVVDGASTDHTAEVVRRHGSLVSLFHSEADCGEAHGLNRGILRARGRIVKQLTDDDYFFPDAMRRAVEVLEAHPEIDALICGGEAHEFDPASGVSRPIEFRYLPAGLRLRDDVAHVLDSTQCGLGLVLTRRAVERVGLFDTTFRAVDTDYMARLISSGADVRYLGIKLFRHVTHAHSGQHFEDECQRDRVRAMVHARAWPALLDRHAVGAVADGFGLQAVPSGKAMARLIYYAERLRRGRLAWVLHLMAGGLHVAGRVAAPFRRGLRKLLPGLAARDPRPDLSVEPDWDGTLR